MTHVQALVGWYQIHQRQLPFRINRDPYRIWISEMMAQQTQIDTLVPYYQKWMDRFPTLDVLARAQEHDVLQIWQGLGYYSRARNILKAAKVMAEKYDGQLPKTYAELIELPGVGPYSAAAIASICFDQKVAAMDGNVKRVMSRLFMWDETVLKKKFNQDIQTRIEAWMEVERPHEVTQAIMELGALICTKTPKCAGCPLQSQCLAYQNHVVHEYPKPITKKNKEHQSIDVVYLHTAQNQFALTLEHSDDLMKGLYRLPAKTQIEANLDVFFINQRTHIFSHKIWDVHFYSSQTTFMNPQFVWITHDQIKDYPIITVHRKWLEEKALALELELC